MRKLIVTIAVVSLLTGLGAVTALGAGAKAGGTGDASVPWRNPTIATTIIVKGKSVTWIWAGDAPHNVKGPGFLSTTTKQKGFRFSHRFNRRGKFLIICTLHPKMKSSVIVR